MYTRKEMFEVDYISQIANQSEGFEWRSDKTVTEFVDDVARLVAKIKGIDVVPKFSYVLTPYIDENEKLIRATFIIKLRKKFRLEGDNPMKYSAVVLCDNTVYKHLARVIANWVDNVNIAYKAIENANELNAFLAENVPNSKIDFAYSKTKIASVSDEKLTVGLDDAQCADIADLPFFDSFEVRSENAANAMVDIMDSITRPLEFFRTKNFLTDSLDIRNRISFARLIKKAYTQDIKKVSNKKEGVFRFENDEYIGLIARVTDGALPLNMDFIMGEDFIYYWVLSPIRKDTEESVFDENIKSELLASVMK